MSELVRTFIGLKVVSQDNSPSHYFLLHLTDMLYNRQIKTVEDLTKCSRQKLHTILCEDSYDVDNRDTLIVEFLDICETKLSESGLFLRD